MVSLPWLRREFGPLLSSETACGLQCLQRFPATLVNSYCWKKEGLRLTSLTGGTAERKAGRKSAVSQLSYHLWLGGYRLQNGKKTQSCEKRSATPARLQDMKKVLSEGK